MFSWRKPSAQDHSEEARGREMLEMLPRVSAPDAIWASIESHLRVEPAAGNWRWAWVAVSVAGLAGIGFWGVLRIEQQPPWDVVRLEGSPRVAGKKIANAGKVSAGEWIETDSGSTATLHVGQIGSVEIAPNTRVRVVKEHVQEHRLALARGEIHAVISAPPRLFFVDTAAGAAVDLGCEFTLTTNEQGSGLLRVTKGWVAFEWKGSDSLVPAGASCRLQAGAGPGLPCFDDAPVAFREAALWFGFSKSDDQGMETILIEARARDLLTLLHLLPRVGLADRARIYDRMASLARIPAGVSRDKALALDPATLNRWKEQLIW